MLANNVNLTIFGGEAANNCATRSLLGLTGITCTF
jgi:hypothetical protein